MEKSVAIVFSTYRNAEQARACLQSIYEQDYRNIRVFAADDGSGDRTMAEMIDEVLDNPRCLPVQFLPLAHGERGIARDKAISEAMATDPDYLLFIDSDMTLARGCIKACVEQLEKDATCGALVLPEKPISMHHNFFTRVKIFERTVLNDAGKRINDASIEAARFWNAEAYRLSGGLDPRQTAFEEIQPTIAYRKLGGKIRRITKTYLTHDEKMVTFKNIMEKKSGYFSAMNVTAETAENGIGEMLKRWYFFRPVLYRPRNILRYITHPFLALGMTWMYLALSWVAFKKIIAGRLVPAHSHA